jgi:hypothetical protein
LLACLLRRLVFFLFGLVCSLELFRSRVMLNEIPGGGGYLAHILKFSPSALFLLFVAVLGGRAGPSSPSPSPSRPGAGSGLGGPSLVLYTLFSFPSSSSSPRHISLCKLRAWSCCTHTHRQAGRVVWVWCFSWLGFVGGTRCLIPSSVFARTGFMDAAFFFFGLRTLFLWRGLSG